MTIKQKNSELEDRENLMSDLIDIILRRIHKIELIQSMGTKDRTLVPNDLSRSIHLIRGYSEDYFKMIKEIENVLQQLDKIGENENELYDDISEVYQLFSNISTLFYQTAEDLEETLEETIVDRHVEKV